MGKQDIAWCPGCGDYGILSVLKEALRELELDPQKTVLVSGIGQAAKTPQYVKTHYFNGLHGRALPPATGISLANPELNVIVTSGDGDMYGEGGNHFIHTIRRNPNITILVYNNMIYGLTKGQASPTSTKGMKTPVQVDGVFLEPFNPLSIAISLDAALVARASISNPEKTKQIIKEAIKHKGTTIVDIFQPCVSFNKLNTYEWFEENTYYLDETHNPYSREDAFKKSIESVESGKLPLGIIYISKNKKTFNEHIQEVNKDKEPLYKHNLQKQELQKLIESKIEKTHTLPQNKKKAQTTKDEYNVEIIEEWQETHNSKSIALKIPEEYEFKSGQHTTIKLKQKDSNKILSAPFSISNPPTDKNKIIITFKKVGELTEELYQKKVGDTITITKPYGDEFIFDESNNKNYVMLAGGTGITPFMSIIRYILAKGKKNKIILFNGNIKEEDIIFKEELEKINTEQEHIKIINILNAPTKECKYDCEGYITADIIKKYTENPQDYEFMICGPPPMIHAMQGVTAKLEIKPEKIHCEEWKINPNINKKTHEGNQTNNENDEEEMATLELGDKKTQLKTGPIMQAAEELGVPFSCREGLCGTCKVKILEGQENLEDKNDKEKNMNLEENERLCCQAKIKKGNVKIDL